LAEAYRAPALGSDVDDAATCSVQYNAEKSWDRRRMSEGEDSELM